MKDWPEQRGVKDFTVHHSLQFYTTVAKWLSGTRNRVCCEAPWVRIPLSPPLKTNMYQGVSRFQREAPFYYFRGKRVRVDNGVNSV